MRQIVTRIGIPLGLALLASLGLSTGVMAQVNATVSGTVSDPTGALIPGVEVSAQNTNTGITSTALSNETGNYNFSSLQPGTYTLSASLPGFQTATYNNVQLSQGQQVRLNFSLQVGAVATAVEVVNDADTVLATTSASVGDVLPDVEVRSLPLASRNVLDLIRTSSAAVGDNFAGAGTDQVATTRDGLPTGDGRYLESNGVYAATFTSPDLVEEVQVNASNIDASMGRGSAQVRMQTRSGGNDFHGALFYTNNNSSLNAQEWFQNLVGAEKSYQNRNQFGGRVGGPILRNKAFFFVLYDGQRYLEKEDVVSDVLTAPARQGIFRYLTENATGAAGGQTRRNGNAFATTPSVDLNGNVLASDAGTPLFLNQIDLFNDVNDPNRTGIDPIWIGPEFLPRLPLPNDWTTGDGLNTAGFRWLRRLEGSDGATGNSPNTNRNHVTVRLDYQINGSNKVTYSQTRESDWGVTGQSGLPGVPAGYGGDVRRNPDFYTASWTSTLSPSVLNEVRWGLKRDTWFGTSAFDKGCCQDKVRRDEDLTESAKEAVASFPSIGGYFAYVDQGLGSAYAPFGVASPRGSISPLTQLADTVSWATGAHSFQGGFEATFAASDQFNHGGSQTTRPRLFLGVGAVPVPGLNQTNFPGLNSNDSGPAEDVLANLAGTVEEIRHELTVNSATATEWLDYRTEIMRIRDIHQNDWAAFFKDTWSVTNNLTLNLGLRYDKYGTPYDTTGLGGRPAGGEAGMFGISGTDFSALWNPYAAGGSLTLIERAGKHSPNPDTLIFGNDWNNFAPSFGFSWNLPWFDRSTVLRGGYGINYTGQVQFLSYSGNIANLPGSTIGITYNPVDYLNVSDMVGPRAGLLPLDTGGALPFEPVPLTNRNNNIDGYTDHRVLPYVQNFNLSVQRELASNLTFEVSWVGSKSSKLWAGNELNHQNIFENGILDAFNQTRAGGDAPLFDQILMGLDVPGSGVVDGTTVTGSEALRQFNTTNRWIANGDVANLADWFNRSSNLTGENGGLLRNGGLPENFIVVNPQFGSVALQGNLDNASYHSLQAQITRRLSNGFSSQFSYTWSKALGNTGQRDPRNRNLDKGLLGFHRTHSLRTHGTWMLPFGPGRALLSGAPGWVHRVVEGWDVSGILSWNSGAPLDFGGVLDTMSTRAGTSVDLVGNLPEDLGRVKVGDGVVEYLAGLSTDRAPMPNFGGHARLANRFNNQVVVDASGNIVLQNPEPGTVGTLGANMAWLEGPGSFGLDLALTKHVQISESLAFVLRVDAINALNTPQWDDPETSIGSSSFGRITGAEGSRSITINARVDF